MKVLLRLIPLVFALALGVAACTGDAEVDGEDVPLERMDRDTLEVEAGRAFDDTVRVDTTAADTTM